MGEYLIQLLIATIPALITGGLAYLTAINKSKNKINAIKVSAEEVQKENKDKFKELEKERQHDLKKLKEERSADLKYYQGQLEAQAKYDETKMQNNFAYKAISDLYEKHDGDFFKISEEASKLDGISQADKIREVARKKKKK